MSRLGGAQEMDRETHRAGSVKYLTLYVEEPALEPGEIAEIVPNGRPGGRGERQRADRRKPLARLDPNIIQRVLDRLLQRHRPALGEC
jgi:hypothetical protein